MFYDVKILCQNKHVVVFWDFVTKWPLVFPVSAQKSISIARLLAEQVIPVHGVPEAPLYELAITFDEHNCLLSSDDGMVEWFKVGQP